MGQGGYGRSDERMVLGHILSGAVAVWDWCGFTGGLLNAPQEIQRILSHGLDKAMQARLAVSRVLAKYGFYA